MYDLLIVGGGLQGVFFAHALHSRRIIDAKRIAIADPNQSLAAVWTARSARVGMDMLRSPSSHNIDPDYRALRRFARRREYNLASHLRYPYARPSLELFNDHLRETISAERLTRSHLQCRVESIDALRNGYRAHTTQGAIESKLVLIATGPGGVHTPAFLAKYSNEDTRISHLFAGTDAIDSPSVPEEDPHADAASNGERILILGGGISAWQAALRYARLGAGRVTLASPHPIRVSIFDSDPCYMGPKCGDEYRALPIPERLKTLQAVRYPGTVPPELASTARSACARGEVDTLQMTAIELRRNSCGIRVVGETGETSDEYDRVTAATGLSCDIPYPKFIDSTSERLSLPVYDSGHPVLANDLSWARGLFVTGRLGELVIGPQAGNIVGAHLALRRISASLTSGVGSAARMHPAGA